MRKWAGFLPVGKDFTIPARFFLPVGKGAARLGGEGDKTSRLPGGPNLGKAVARQCGWFDDMQRGPVLQVRGSSAHHNEKPRTFTRTGLPCLKVFIK
jgi:hypothetical protein